MVEITINKTSKPLGNSQENYSTFDYEVKQFKSKEDAINFLKKEYQGVKRIKMYIGDGDFAG